MAQEEYRDDSCKEVNYCTQSTFEHPIFSSGNCTDLMDSLIQSFLLVSTYSQNLSEFRSTEDVAREFITEFRLFELDFPETSGVHELSRVVQIQYHDSAYTSLLMSEYIYTGGAHGNSHYFFKNIRHSDCKLMSWSDVFEGWTADSLSNLLAQTYLESKGYDPEVSLYEAGLLVDSLELTNNFGILEDRIVFLYNSYEIASYADGVIEIEVPIPAGKRVEQAL